MVSRRTTLLLGAAIAALFGLISLQPGSARADKSYQLSQKRLKRWVGVGRVALSRPFRGQLHRALSGSTRVLSKRVKQGELNLELDRGIYGTRYDHLRVNRRPNRRPRRSNTKWDVLLSSERSVHVGDYLPTFDEDPVELFDYKTTTRAIKRLANGNTLEVYANNNSPLDPVTRRPTHGYYRITAPDGALLVKRGKLGTLFGMGQRAISRSHQQRLHNLTGMSPAEVQALLGSLKPSR